MTIKKFLFNQLVAPFLDSAVEPIVRRQFKKNLLEEPLIWGEESQLNIAPTAQVNNAFFNLSSGSVTIEDHVFFGNFVHLLTGTHDYTKFDRERELSVPASGRDIVVKRGAWIASDAILLGPCVIGEHAVVAAGSLVRGDVAPYTVVAGRPAKLVKTLSREETDSVATEAALASRAG